MIPETFLFDLDGTLVDSAADLAAAVNRLRRELGYPDLDTSDVCGMIGDGASMLVRRALPGDLFGQDLLQRFLEIYRNCLLDRTRPYPGIPDFLRNHSPENLAVVTNKPLVLAEEILAGLQMRSLFGSVVGGDSCSRKKPGPEPVFLALQRLGVDPAGAVMIGDHHVDLAAGNAAGTRTCFCAWGFGNDNGMTSDFRVETPDDLLKLFPGRSR